MDRDNVVVEKKIIADKLDHAGGKPDWKPEVPNKEMEDFFARHARELKQHNAVVSGNTIEFPDVYGNGKKIDPAEMKADDKTAYWKKIDALKGETEPKPGPADDKTVYLKKVDELKAENKVVEKSSYDGETQPIGAAKGTVYTGEPAKGSVHVSY